MYLRVRTLGYADRMASISRRQIDGLKLAESHMAGEISPVPRKLVRKTLEFLDVLPELSKQTAADARRRRRR